MYYKNRNDAAQQLSTLLQTYDNAKDVIVIALARGGIIIGDIIAKNLNLKLDIIIPQKLSSPTSDELAIGAICEDSIFLNEQLIHDLDVSQDYLKEEIDKKKNIIIEKKKLYNKNLASLNLKNKTVILVDDGIATGATIIAAILALKKKEAKKIVIATPIASRFVIENLQKLVDKIICPYIPDDFYAISQYYDNFEQITDNIVIKILK